MEESLTLNNNNNNSKKIVLPSSAVSQNPRIDKVIIFIRLYWGVV